MKAAGETQVEVGGVDQDRAVGRAIGRRLLEPGERPPGRRQPLEDLEETHDRQLARVDDPLDARGLELGTAGAERREGGADGADGAHELGSERIAGRLPRHDEQLDPARGQSPAARR